MEIQMCVLKWAGLRPSYFKVETKFSLFYCDNSIAGETSSASCYIPLAGVWTRVGMVGRVWGCGDMVPSTRKVPYPCPR